jgi:hypothetical protein
MFIYIFPGVKALIIVVGRRLTELAAGRLNDSMETSYP